MANGFVVHNCENFKISQKVRKDINKHFYPEHIINIAQEKHCKSVCMTYNEPIICYEYLMDVADECHKNNIKFIIKTNAYVNKEPWSDICKVVDAMNIDWKGSEEQYKEVVGANCYVIRDRIGEAYDNGVHIEISIPLYHHFLKDVRIFYQCGSFLSTLDKNIPCHLLSIVGANQHDKYSSTPDLDISVARRILSFYMDKVYS